MIRYDLVLQANQQASTFFTWVGRQSTIYVYIYNYFNPSLVSARIDNGARRVKGYSLGRSLGKLSPTSFATFRTGIDSTGRGGYFFAWPRSLVWEMATAMLKVLVLSGSGC